MFKHYISDLCKSTRFARKPFKYVRINPMQNLKESIRQQILRVVKTNKLEVEESISLTHPDEQFGDFTTNFALMSKQKGKISAYVAAQDFARLLRNDGALMKYIERIEVAGPGFINFYLRSGIYIKELKNVLSRGGKYGSSTKNKGKKVVIDYSSPNIAKRFGIGHLRSTIIGQAIYNILKYSGWKTIGINHIGDWGTQFGKLIVSVRRWSDKPARELSVNELEKLYVRFHREAEQNPQLIEEARQAFKSLEDNKPEERDIWQQLVSSSLEEFGKLYDLLNVNIDFAYGESRYHSTLKLVTKDAIRKKVAKESAGALIVEFPNEQLPPALLRKSDGASTYFARDLAAIRFRKQKWNPDFYVYEVGSEQQLHFKQVFKGAELLGYGTRDQFVHISHGEIRADAGRMSTRKGNTIKLEEVIKRAIQKAESLAKDKSIAAQVGIGAIKYNDLKRTPSSSYVFNWDDVINLEGDSGPYLQYTYARGKSVLQKAERERDSSSRALNDYQLNREELGVVRWVTRFPEVVEAASERLDPSMVCHYLFDLAQKYNTFYSKHPVLVARTSEQRAFRLLLTRCAIQILKNGLDLLGIPVLDRM